MITVLLKIILVSVIWCLGIKIVTSTGMVLEKLGGYGQKKVKEGYKIFEALICCEWCLASIHSSIGLLFTLISGIVIWDIRILYLYPIIAMGTSFCTGILWNLWVILKTKIAYFENLEVLTHYEIKDRKKNHYEQKLRN